MDEMTLPEVPRIMAALKVWEVGYRAAAERDGLWWMKDQLTATIDRPTARQVRRALEDTVALVKMAGYLAFLSVRRVPASVFLARQVYAPTAAAGRYLIHFVDFDLSARWLVVNELWEAELDTLVDGDWVFSRNGIEHLEVCRTSGRAMPVREQRALRRDLLGTLSIGKRPPAGAVDLFPSGVFAFIPQLRPE